MTAGRKRGSAPRLTRSLRRRRSPAPVNGLTGNALAAGSRVNEADGDLRRRRAVFLDRDGVLNRAIVRDGEPYPPRSVTELEILLDVPEALAELRRAGFLLLVVTNQPDVARGTQSREAVEEINAALARALPLDAVLTCYDDGDSPRRKPNPGLLLEAAEQYAIDLQRSYLIGDRWKDIEAGRRAGCRTVLIDYGYMETRPDPAADFITQRIMKAARWIVAEAEGEER
jgi:D-glycero-D-manno-heptose 1,7-bisphosphate phosphatase